MAARFPLGRVVITSHAQRLLHEVDITRGLMRHMRGDWGDVGDEDKAENELSLREGFRLLSSYRDRRDMTFWIITEADRSATTILLPEDY